MELTKLFGYFTALVVLTITSISEAAPTLNHSQQTQISKRWDDPPPASSEVWKNAICKGNHLLASMAGSDEDAGKLYKPPRANGQSPFRHILGMQPVCELYFRALMLIISEDDMKKWGYTIEQDEDEPTDEAADIWEISEALTALGLNHGGPISFYRIFHEDKHKVDENGVPIFRGEQTYEVNGKKYRVSGAGVTSSIAPHFKNVQPTDELSRLQALLTRSLSTM